MIKNPFLARLCSDTAWCLNEPSNPCGLSGAQRQDLRDWYVANCGGSPDLVASTLPSSVGLMIWKTWVFFRSLRGRGKQGH
jgi:hypothetical protein